MSDQHAFALSWLPADGAWRAEPEHEPELSRVVDALSAYANATKGCEPVWLPRFGWGWRLTDKGKAVAIARPRSSDLEHG